MLSEHGVQELYDLPMTLRGGQVVQPAEHCRHNFGLVENPFVPRVCLSSVDARWLCALVICTMHGQRTESFEVSDRFLLHWSSAMDQCSSIYGSYRIRQGRHTNSPSGKAFPGGTLGTITPAIEIFDI